MSGRIKRDLKEDHIGLPRLGFIKTGHKNEKGRPVSTNYFQCTGKYSKYFSEAYKGSVEEIQIIFLSDDPMVSCEERYELRDNEGRLYSYGDGKTYNVFNATINKYESFSVTDFPDLKKYIEDKSGSKKGWEEILTMRFIIPKITGIAGYWQYTTRGAASSIPSIVSSFDTIVKMNGSVSGVIFDMVVGFAKSQKPGVLSRYPVVNIIPNHSKENLELVKSSLLKLKKNELS